MENQFIFKLKRAIVLPISLNEKQGMVVYNARDFGLAYSVIPNPKEKQLQVSLLICRIDDESIVRSLATYNITEQGFPTGTVLNTKEIETALLKKQTLETQIIRLDSAIRALYIYEAELLEAGENASEVSIEITEKTNLLNQARLDLNTLTIPSPELEYANKYSDIIDYFNKDGSITKEGIEWARSVPFLGLTLNDYLI